MLASSPAADFVVLRRRTRDHSMSPSCRISATATPPPLTATFDRISYDSPMLTPSRSYLHRSSDRSLLHPDGSSGGLTDTDDIFLQSPFKSPHIPTTNFAAKPHSIQSDDDEGNIFISTISPAPTSPFCFPPSSSQPLRTPVKQGHRPISRSALSMKNINAQNPLAPLRPATIAKAGGGMKRKTATMSSTYNTPSHQRTFTPLNVLQVADPSDHGMTFDRLAPLPAPRFSVRTPQTKAETEKYLSRHTESMTRLRIDSGDELGGSGDDSGCEMELDEDEKDREDALFLGTGEGLKRETVGLKLLVDEKSQGKDGEVAADISPGGHVNKRRARSRPVSLELLESVHHTPSPSTSQPDIPNIGISSANIGPIAFPSLSNIHRRNPSNSPGASSEDSSPLPRRRAVGVTRSSRQRVPTVGDKLRISLGHKPNNSSGTLFFGPSIPPTELRDRKRTSSSTLLPEVSNRANDAAPRLSNRHSYAGVEGGILPSSARQAAAGFPSSLSGPSLSTRNASDTEEEDTFFSSGPQDSSFVFSVTEGTPSPRSRRNVFHSALPKKYKPRDSGCVLTDEEDQVVPPILRSRPGTFGRSESARFLTVLPGVSASTSDSSMGSDVDRLITPGWIPELNSGWPQPAVVDSSAATLATDQVDGDPDAFILKTLAAGPRGEHAKKPPGTPVKKVKIRVDRPWQSAVAAKVMGGSFGLSDKKGKKPPRKSLPAAFPTLGRRGVGVDSDTDEDELNSPSARKDGRYDGLGIGRPTSGPRQWLLRRTSSGAFSSGSDVSSSGTPSRIPVKDWHMPALRLPVPPSPLNGKAKLSLNGRGTSSSSSSSSTALNSPTLPLHILGKAHPALPAHHDSPRSPEVGIEGCGGRFEKEFIELEELGSGEFGKVMRVHYKDGRPGVFAVKKSKRFEGARHRLRLREEVDVLQHLSKAVHGQHHPNVLAYIDSWEQDDQLFIQTELCEMGNFAQFLWEYGRSFPRLDEAKVWKIIVDLGNGLRFIHDCSVIHLDLKPANIFVTGEGRFKIGDFGMASVWPRVSQGEGHDRGIFEREGDKNYLAPEVLQGKYSKAADIFSFGMTVLEAAANVVIPDQGDSWHRLRQEDFSEVDLEDVNSVELVGLIKSMMRAEPARRVDVRAVWAHPVVARTRAAMERMAAQARRDGSSVFVASPLAGVPASFLDEILGRPGGGCGPHTMNVCA